MVPATGADIPGTFLHTDLDEEVIMLLRGQLADLMVEVDPELYGPYLRKTKKGESILYVKMLKAMYGLLRSALLLYMKLVKDLADFGFELNPLCGRHEWTPRSLHHHLEAT